MSAGSKAVIMMTSRGAARHSGTQRPAALRAKIGDKLVIDEPGGARQARIGEITACPARTDRHRTGFTGWPATTSP